MKKYILFLLFSLALFGVGCQTLNNDSQNNSPNEAEFFEDGRPIIDYQGEKIIGQFCDSYHGCSSNPGSTGYFCKENICFKPSGMPVGGPLELGCTEKEENRIIYRDNKPFICTGLFFTEVISCQDDADCSLIEYAYERYCKNNICYSEYDNLPVFK